MAGYLNRFIDLAFPDLAGVDDNGRALCWVKIRNPRLIPASELFGSTTVPLGTDGQPVDASAAADQSLAMAQRLIIAGRVWDPTCMPVLDENGDPIGEDPDAPLLPIPLSDADVRKLPMEIFSRISEEVSKATPR